MKISYSRKSKNEFWGRFGGGWQWKLGFQLGGNTLIINLLICDIRFDII